MRARAVGIDLLLVFHRLEIVDDDGNEQVDDDEHGHEHEAAEIDPVNGVRLPEEMEAKHGIHVEQQREQHDHVPHRRDRSDHRADDQAQLGEHGH
jgi:hypothetical protein